MGKSFSGKVTEKAGGGGGFLVGGLLLKNSIALKNNLKKYEQLTLTFLIAMILNHLTFPKMKNFYPFLFVFSISIGTQYGQLTPTTPQQLAALPSENFKSHKYFKQNSRWHLYDSLSQKLVPLNEKEITLIFGDSATASQISSFESTNNLTFLRKAETGWHDYTLPLNANIFTVAKALRSSAIVDNVEITGYGEFLLQANDSAYYHAPTQQYYQWSHRSGRADVEGAWNKTTGDPSVVIGFIDTGVDWFHEDFAQASPTAGGGFAGTFWLNPGEDEWSDHNDPSTGNKLDDDGNGYIDDWRGWNFQDDTNDVRDYVGPTSNYHGTGVAGIAVARSNNQTGVAGVAGGWGSSDGVKAMVIKTHSAFNGTIPDIVFDDALEYAAINGANIISTSLGIYSNFVAINDAIELVYNNYDCIITAASGNSNTNNSGKPTLYPANHPLVLGVARSNDNDKVFQSHTGYRLDLTAPGHDLPILKPTIPAPAGKKYVNQSGSSLSSPFVAGIAGLMLSINPCLGNEEAYNILKHRADKVGGYNYNHSVDSAGHSLRMGWGRVNAQRAVNTAEAMKINNLDLYIKDRNDDFGYFGSYDTTLYFDEGPDIWVRQQPDGFVNQWHQNPESDTNSPVYVYVRVHNKSCVPSSGNETLDLHWSKLSTNNSWPSHWDGSTQHGDTIASVPIPLLEAGGDTILEIAWQPTDGDGYPEWGVCLLARIISQDDPITPYPNNLSDEIKLNNNLAVINIRVTNATPEKIAPVVNGVEYPHGTFVYVGNGGSDNQDVFDINFDTPENYSGNSIVDEAEVHLFLGDEFWSILQSTNPATDWIGMEQIGEQEFMVMADHAQFRNMVFPPGIQDSIYVGFNFLTDEIDDKHRFGYHVSQSRSGAEGYTGGAHFIINKAEREEFQADGGPDQSTYQGQSTSMQASSINEPATYNWYDSSDSLVYSGQTMSVSPQVTEKYRLEIISDENRFKDYDTVQVNVNPYAIRSIAPNPASNQVTIDYDADEAKSAYLSVFPTSNPSAVNNYILNTNLNLRTFNVSSVPANVYTVQLVCDGVVVDNKSLIIQ